MLASKSIGDSEREAGRGAGEGPRTRRRRGASLASPSSSPSASFRANFSSSSICFWRRFFSAISLSFCALVLVFLLPICTISSSSSAVLSSLVPNASAASSSSFSCSLLAKVASSSPIVASNCSSVVTLELSSRIVTGSSALVLKSSTRAAVSSSVVAELSSELICSSIWSESLLIASSKGSQFVGSNFWRTTTRSAMSGSRSRYLCAVDRFSAKRTLREAEVESLRSLSNVFSHSSIAYTSS
mmetsp:Transcript_6497/g.10104  ORF Transcript_6497/g.10104 Transcript_6497/m.10104 type:complete len:243 (-) Transcript_6497:32-760(-)